MHIYSIRKSIKNKNDERYYFDNLYLASNENDYNKRIKYQVRVERANALTRKSVSSVTVRSERQDHDASIRSTFPSQLSMMRGLSSRTRPRKLLDGEYTHFN
jgi:hypothetical protein